MTVRAGVIGVGIMGAEHARLLAEVLSGSEVSAVFDVDAARAKIVGGACGAQAMDDPMVLIKDDSVDCVLIASSDQTHEQFVLAALGAGKPVFCEKPLAPDPASCLRILTAEAEQGRRCVSVGFMRRFDPGYLALRADFRGGAIGRAVMMHCVHRNVSAVGVPSPVLITGSAVHEFDIARWLLDEEPASIAVHTPRPSGRAGGTQDPMLLVLRTESGVLVDVEVFLNAGYGYDVRCELVGESGTVLLDMPAATVRRTAGSAARVVGADWRDRFGEAYRRELQDWVDAVAAVGESGAASAWDGYVATEVAQAGVRALSTGATQDIVLADKPAMYR